MPQIAATWSAGLGNSTLIAPQRLKILKKKMCLYAIPSLRRIPGRMVLHVFMQAIQVWKDCYDGSELEFKRRHFPPGTTADQVMACAPLLASMSDWEREGFAMTQVIEAGNGKWVKGTTIQYGSENGSLSLAELFWNAGDIDPTLLPPFWLCIHKCGR